MKPIAGDLNVHADRLNLNDFMGTDTTASDNTATEPFVVPKKGFLYFKCRCG